ncbi:protein OSB1, mitochondrial isoform X2 [Manihot esculenta]|uniref:Uncharacterized protein n=2 Tax=Manihot esculenta TaxID=3983 RepID=A0ACB7FXF9_MANES|nr:protein OSB1, mitochondrial isoform X2 [Manihot esculenta]KAG8632567.1 hypothetical protein MANES_18G034800v8 [Manihot esculenta]
MKKACPFQFLIRNATLFSLQRLASFSSYSSAIPRSLSSSTDEDDVEAEEGGSSVYRHALQHQRPTTIRWQPQLENSVSFIGRVGGPLEIYKTKGDDFGAYTFIHVGYPGRSNCTFRMQVEMRDDMAKVGNQHLKKNDTVYVSGRLGSYKKADGNGNLISFYKIIVKDLYYVAPCDQGPISQNPEELQSKACQKSVESQSKPCQKSVESQSKPIERTKESQSVRGESGLGNCANHLYLWQLFFCKPYEWWDKRKNKQNSSSPDFKHKNTGENLWLRPDDPPWVKRQLQLLDLEIAKQRRAQGGCESGIGRKSQHHLWHVFFRNPHEWRDNRQNKKNSRSPDFKHKFSGEALWMSEDDPPWVKRQLQFHDSNMAKQGQGENVFKWKFDGEELI